jgi:hypothetical protein
MRARTLTAALIAAGIAIAGCGTSAKSASPSYPRPAVAGKEPALAQSRAGGPARCGPGEIAAVSVIRPGVAPAALGRLQPRPLALLADHGSGGELAFFSPAQLPSGGTGIPLSRPAPVLQDPRLQSCEYLLQDRPAAQPYIAAAVAAAVRHGLAASARKLRARLEIILIGDNPLRSSSLVVTLLVSGPKIGTIGGHAVYGPYRSIFAVLSRATRNVTAVAAGTWPG